jgi:hypothetical protein
MALPSKGKRDLDKEQYWRKIFVRFADSGKSRAQFCKDEGLKADVFVYWKKAIEQRDAEAQAAKAQTKRKGAKDFVHVNVVDETPKPVTKNHKPVAQIVFSGGSVMLFENADLNILKHLLQALKETAD